MGEDERVKSKQFDLKIHGIIGIILIIFAEGAVILRNRFYFAQLISIWITPLCWWGYIMIIDSIIFYLKGESVMVNHKREFFGMLILSNIFWIIFEVYNFHLKNWRYMGLPRNPLIKVIGIFLAFATIMPGMFFTAELIQIFGVFDRVKMVKLKIGKRGMHIFLILGLCFMICPLLVTRCYAKYLFALVWVGIFFLLEPINYASGTESFLRDFENGKLDRFLSYLIAGYICGILWEFWNYWAVAKWIYTAPFTRDVRVFEMPIAGFLGFGPFSLEYFTMYHFARLLHFKRPVLK